MSNRASLGESPMEALIPALPDEIALQCLARVPRQYHPVLSAVSKPIRSLLSSPDFFAARSSLNCAEPLLYLKAPWLSNQPVGSWFTLYRSPNSNPDENKINIVKAPVPRSPSDNPYDSASAAVGHKIYVLGGHAEGNYRPTNAVWILDCRHGTWERGPSMRVARTSAAAVVFDGKIYVIGGSIPNESWAEVFDPVGECWKALPEPPVGLDLRWIYDCAMVGGRICVWLVQDELRFDPATETWEVLRSGEEPEQGRKVREVNRVVYGFFPYRNKFQVFDNGMWKELEIVNTELFNPVLSKKQMFNVGGKLVITVIGYSEPNTNCKVWCAEIGVNKDGNGDLCGEFLWLETIDTLPLRLLERESTLSSCASLSYTCLSVSL